MLETWYYIALGLCALAVLVLSGALYTTIRVLGKISAVERELLRYKTEVEQLDIRITREVKARAGLQRAADVADERTVLDQARATLAEDPPRVGAVGRPSRLRRI